MKIVALFIATAVLSAPATAADVERAYVDSRTGQLHVRVASAKTDARTLVLLHQVPNSGQVFEPFLKAISSRRSAVAFDLPGFGMSDPMPDQDSIEGYAQAILDGLDALDLSDIDIVGYHTGAAVAAEMLRLQPKRIHHVVLASVPVLSAQERAQFAALPPIPFDEDGVFAQREFERSMRWRGPGQSTDSIKRTFAEKMRPGARERGATAVVAYDLAATLRSIQKKVLVLRPRDDLWEATLRAKPLLANAVWVEYPDHGHGLFEVIPDELADLIDYYLEQPLADH